MFPDRPAPAASTPAPRGLLGRRVGSVRRGLESLRLGFFLLSERAEARPRQAEEIRQVAADLAAIQPHGPVFA
jgi:hypothetical protein